MGVVPVHEEFSTRETWPMECLHCGRLWQEEYLVRRLTDEHGHDVVLWLRSGVLVQPPWSGVSCPGCGDASVKAFPTGNRPHRAVRGGRPAPAAKPGPVPAPAVKPDSAPARVPAAKSGPAPSRGSRPGRRRPPVLLYALLGIAFLLLTSFEAVQYVAAHH
ncbi:hypothetical protein [Streptosporangium sp. NPDC000396]|uniref:hypothetical protein n=1 Tax=Streptosporangium sp. NPDC000396 TaxID=3366185 RepID=UPI0036A9B906